MIFTQILNLSTKRARVGDVPNHTHPVSIFEIGLVITQFVYPNRITAMVLVWQYGEKSGNESWKGLSWGMVS